MKKRITSLLIVLCAVALLSMTVFAAIVSETRGTLTYAFDSDSFELTISGKGNITIADLELATATDQPDTTKLTIYVDASEKITIPDKMCYGWDDMTDLIIYGDVEIGKEAFSGTTKLSRAIFFGDADIATDNFLSCASDFKLYGYTGSTAKTYANSHGITFVPIPLKVTGGTLGTDYTYDVAGGVLTVLTDTSLTIANVDPNTATSHRIVVTKDKKANITLAGVNIENNTASPFEIEKDSKGDVTITLADGTTNTLKATGTEYAALQKEGSVTNIGKLTIQAETAGTGKLIAKALGAAGIGSNGDPDHSTAAVSNITISGGTVTAASETGAGIGSGLGDESSGSVSNITISGGTVTAASETGAGIGSGYAGATSGAVSGVKITGGSVKASSIGKGDGTAVTPTDSTGNNVYLLEIDTTGGDNVSVNWRDYPARHKYYDFGLSKWIDETKIYVYLPDETHRVTVGGNTTKYMLSGTSFAPLNGSCGATAADNVTWTLDPTTGTMTISGTGAMADYTVDSQAVPNTGTGGWDIVIDSDNRPWASLIDAIKKVVIKDGVTSVGQSAFDLCANLANVDIADSVSSIGVCAFSDAALTSVVLGGDVTVKNYAFMNNKLTSIVFAGNVKLDGEHIFKCDTLNSVYSFGGLEYPRDLDYMFGVSTPTFYGYTGSAVYTLVTTSGYPGYSFSPLNGTCGATETDNVTWKLSADGTMAISGTGAMADYTFTYINGTISGDTRPWKDLVGMIKKVVVENGVTRIGAKAFGHCAEITSLCIANNINSIGGCAFYCCTKLTSVDILGTINSIDSEAFCFCSGLESVTVLGNIESIGSNAFANCGQLKSVTVLGNIESIGSNAFANCGQLKSVAVLGDEGIGSIGDHAFCRNTSLKSLYILGGIYNASLDIPIEAFENVPDSFTIYRYATSNVKEWMINFGYTSFTYSQKCFVITGGKWGTDYTYDIVNGVLTVLTDKELTIKNMDANEATSHHIVVKKDVDANITLAGVNIAINAATGSPFEIAQDSEGDVTITLKDDTTNTLKVGSYSYAALQKVGDGENIGTLTIKGGTQGTGKLLAEAPNGAGIGGSRGEDDNAVSNITISGGCVTANSTNGAGIGSGSSGTRSGKVSNITITGGCVTANSTNGAGIGSGRGDSSSGSTSNIVITGGSVKASSLGCQPTDGSNNVYLLEIDTSNSGTSTGDIVSVNGKDYPAWHYYYYFDGTGTLVSAAEPQIYVYLPDATHSVTVGNNTTSYILAGTSFAPLSGSCGASATDNVTWVFDPATGTMTVSGKGEMKDFIASSSSIPWKDFRDKIKKVVIKDGITNVSRLAFADCTNLTSVDIPDSVSSIGESAFSCTGLTSVAFGSDVELGASAFDGCENLTSVVFGADSALGARAFGDCKSLTSVYFFGNVKTDDVGEIAIGTDCFNKCPTTITLYGYSDNDNLKQYCQTNSRTFSLLNGELGSLTWRLGSDGTLTFGGSGTLNYSATDAPWKLLVDNNMVKKLVIKNGVTYESLGITPKYTVTIKDGDTIVEKHIFLTDDGKVTEPATPTKNGYKFLGWHNGETKYDFDSVVSSDLTITAKWESPDYVGTLNDAIKDLQTAKTDLESALAKKADDATINAKINAVNAAITDLQTALAGKADKADLTALQTAVSALQSAVNVLQNAQSNYSTTTEMNNAINEAVEIAKTGLNAGITELQYRMTAAEQKVKDLTDNKADAAALTDAINNLSTLTARLNTIKTALESKDTELSGKIDDIDAALASAKTALNNAIDSLTTRMTAAESKLNDLTTKANTTADELAAAISELTALTNSLNTVKRNLETADTVLEAKINSAQTTLQTAIDKVQKDLNDAKTELNNAIVNGDKNLDAKITALNTALETAQKALEATASADKSELNKMISDAQSTLQTAIDKVQKDLNDAKTELNNAIVNGDKNLDAKITALNTALETAQKALEATASADKSELSKAISDAQSALQTAIDKVQKDLNDAKTELNNAIVNGDKNLDAKITALNTALETAQKALEATASADKSELNKMISDAQSTLQTAVDKVASDLADVRTELAAKDAELEEQNAEQQTFITIVCIIACVSLAGNIAIAVVTFALKRKRIH